MSFTVTSEPIPARFIGDVAFHTVILKIAVRAGMGQDLPTKSELENKIANDLLAMKRLDKGGAWDVSSVIVQEDSDILLIPKLMVEFEQYLRTVLANSELRGALDRISVIDDCLGRTLGLEGA